MADTNLEDKTNNITTLTESELQLLLPHCPCAYHKVHRFFRIAFLTAPCPCCVGCIQSENPRATYVQQARERYAAKMAERSLWSSIFS